MTVLGNNNRRASVGNAAGVVRLAEQMLNFIFRQVLFGFVFRALLGWNNNG